MMNQVSENIKNELVQIENDSVNIAFSDMIQNTLDSFNTLNEWEKNEVELKMHSMLVKRFSFFPSVTDVLVFTRNKEKIIAYGDVHFKFKLKSDYLNSILEETTTNNGVPLWTIQDKANEEDSNNSSFRIENYGKRGILLYRSFKSLQHGTPLGYILIRVDEKYILNKFKHIDLGHGADIFILNSNGMVMSGRSAEVKAAKMYPDSELIQEIKTNKENEIYSFNRTISGKRNLIAYTYIPSADWYVVSTIPFSYINDESIRIGIYIAILGVVCFVLALLLSFIVSRSISNPLKQLLDSMNNVKKGKFVVQIEDRSSDELGVVITNFNTMVSELQFLIDEVKSKEALKRRAELSTLQAQINPHFLSNTLNTVRWLANVQKAENISSLITSLIQLLHVCMGKGGELINIREEIEYVKNYLNIMTYRYYDKFRVHFEMEEGVLDLKILKFIMQPIVENSLLHGIEPMEGQGLIIIKGYRAEDQLIITITDNGVGIPSYKMNNLLQEKLQNKEGKLSGMGIRNVDERIKLYFGEAYGISIQSVPNMLTTIEITIPITGEEGHNTYAQSTYSG
ncbi:sensor histidine kinase [Paenibacillus sp. S3N08]|uniref:Sensor histidine kinase n=1 Tax=Paenibacillus agricola TaxID=2716264 RepID=A0ABX0J7Z7_9BACL|nr:sensor histidine kinase [Paenibacillus agricola]